MTQGNTENLTKAFEGSETSFSAIAVAFYSGLWSYDGWFVIIIYKKNHICITRNQFEICLLNKK